MFTLRKPESMRNMTNFDRIDPKPKGVLRSTKEEVETHLKNTHSDSNREEERQIPSDLCKYSDPEIMFNNEPPSFNELDVEGKLYFAMKADRLLNFTLANQYIDTGVQKGGIPKVSGCLEHTAILSHLIKEAKER